MSEVDQRLYDWITRLRGKQDTVVKSFESYNNNIIVIPYICVEDDHLLMIEVDPCGYVLIEGWFHQVRILLYDFSELINIG